MFVIYGISNITGIEELSNYSEMVGRIVDLPSSISKLIFTSIFFLNDEIYHPYQKRLNNAV